MRSFLPTRFRRIIAFKIGVQVTIVTISSLAAFMLFAAVISAIMAPVEAATNSVTRFFSSEISTDDSVDLATCLTIDATTLHGIVRTVPAHTDVTLAWAWIAHRTREATRSTDAPRYTSITAFAASPDAPDTDAIGNVPPVATSPDELAANAGILELIDRDVISASDDLIAELTTPLVDNCWH